MSKLLSKSKYLIGLQCPKHLWLLVHDPSRIPEPDESVQFRFSQGQLVGEMAKKFFLKVLMFLLKILIRILNYPKNCF